MDPRSTSDRVLLQLKSRGPQTAKDVAAAFAMSVMGAHKVLGALASAGLVRFEDMATGRGRPRRLFSLTEKGHGRFPDRHAELNAELISMIRATFGEEGLARLIAEREARQKARYAGKSDASLDEKVAALVAARTAEGYMAHGRTLEDGAMQLIEDHCPICAAADVYGGFCRSELAIFRAVFGSMAEVTREEHLMSGGCRCIYRITPRRGG